MTSSLSGFAGPTGRNLVGGSSGYNQSVGKRGGGPGDIIPKGYRKGQLQQFAPEQMQLFQQLFGHLGPESYLSRLAGGDEDIFQQIEAPAWRDFEAGLGQLGSRFSEFAPGAMSAQKGGGFKHAGTAAASNFAQDLAANRHKLTSQAINDLMGLSNMLLNQRPYQTDLFEKQQKQQQGKWGGAASGALSGGLSGSAFGPWGTAAGALIGGTAGYFS